MIELPIQNNLFDLLGDDFFDMFLHEMASDDTKEKMEFFLIMKLRTFGIPVLKEDLEVILGNNVNVNISYKLNNLLIKFEAENPEYFI